MVRLRPGGRPHPQQRYLLHLQTGSRLPLVLRAHGRESRTALQIRGRPVMVALVLLFDLATSQRLQLIPASLIRTSVKVIE